MITAKVELTESGKHRLSKEPYKNAEEKIIKEVTEEIFDYIMMGGLGSRLGRTPSGGAPVWEIRKENDPNDAIPRELLNSHKIKLGRTQATISTTNEYATDVIDGIRSQHWVTKYGTSPIGRPNPYHKRAVDTILKSNPIKDVLPRIMSEEQLK